MYIRFIKKLINFLFIITKNMQKINLYIYYQYNKRVVSNNNLADDGWIYYKLNINNIAIMSVVIHTKKSQVFFGFDISGFLLVATSTLNGVKISDIGQKFR